jgi:hypothetical protein
LLLLRLGLPELSVLAKNPEVPLERIRPDTHRAGEWSGLRPRSGASHRGAPIFLVNRAVTAGASFRADVSDARSRIPEHQWRRREASDQEQQDRHLSILRLEEKLRPRAGVNSYINL